jgi:hypothetical protein
VDLKANAASADLTPIRCEGCRHKFHVRLRQSVVVIEQPSQPASAPAPKPSADDTVNPFVSINVTRPSAATPPPPPAAPTPAPSQPSPVAPAESEFQHDLRNLYPGLKRSVWAMLGSPWHSGWLLALLIALTLLPFTLPGLFLAWVVTLFFRPGKPPERVTRPTPAPVPAPTPVPRARRVIPAGAEVGEPIGPTNPLNAGPSESIAVGEPLTWVLNQDKRRAG